MAQTKVGLAPEEKLAIEQALKASGTSGSTSYADMVARGMSPQQAMQYISDPMNASNPTKSSTPPGWKWDPQGQTPAAQQLGLKAIAGSIAGGEITAAQVAANGVSAGMNPDPAKQLQASAPPGTPQAAPPGPPATNPLPSSSGLGAKAVSYGQPSAIDYGALRKRAGNDANLQIQGLRDQALQNSQRFKSEGGSQINSLRAMYAPQYQQNLLNTDNAARGAVQSAANRGFFSSGLSEDAQLRASLAGEQQRMTLQGQETAQVGEIQNRMNLSDQQFGDLLQQLQGKEGQLSQSLADQYGRDAQQSDLQNRQLSSDVALRLMGMDQSYNQFNQGLSWDKNKFGQQLQQGNTQFDQTMQYNQQGRTLEFGDRNANRTWQSQQNQDQRTWQSQQSADTRTWQATQSQLDRDQQVTMSKLDASQKMQLQQSAQAWQGGQASLDRGSSMERLRYETGIKNTWWEEEMKQKVQFRKEDNQQSKDQWNAHYMQTIDQYLNDAKSHPGVQSAWSTYDGAVHELDRVAPRIISEGAQPSLLMGYLKKQFGIDDTQALGGGGSGGGHPTISSQ